MRVLLAAFTLTIALFPSPGHSQQQPPEMQQYPSSSPEQPSTFTDRLTNFPDKLFSRINDKAASLDKQLTRQTVKYLNRLARREAKLKKQLKKYDSTAAKGIFANDPAQDYAALARKLQSDTAIHSRTLTGEYLPYADSLQGSLSFLNRNPQLLDSSKVLPADVQRSLDQLKLLQVKMQNADQITQYIRQRKEQIKQYLLQSTNLPPGIAAAYNDYNKDLYYYRQQMEEYKAELNDPDKLTQHALSLLDKLPAFQEFMKNNSMLASLFPTPGNMGTPLALTGLQTRTQVAQMLQTQLSSGSGAQAAFSQGVEDAQSQLSRLKDRISSYGAGGGDVDIPNFKPNDERTKTFFQRLEYGTNLQTLSATPNTPVTTDIGLSLGYKLSGNNTIGVGASYKLGMGADLSHVSFSNQGAGLRSFVDIHLNKTFYASGGMEYNYQQLIYTQNTFNNLNYWQPSGLIGVSKIVSINTKFFKKTKIQVLWDFLSYQQIPKTQPFKFRVGYNF
jgi:hypothetical protein